MSRLEKVWNDDKHSVFITKLQVCNDNSLHMWLASCYYASKRSSDIVLLALPDCAECSGDPNSFVSYLEFGGRLVNGEFSHVEPKGYAKGMHISLS